MDWSKLLSAVKEMGLGIPGDVVGELVGNLAEGALSWLAGKCRENKFTKKVGEALREFTELPEGERLLVAVFENLPKPQKRLFRLGDRASDVAKTAISDIEGFSVKKWGETLLKGIDLSAYSQRTQRGFFELLTEMQKAAVDYWRSLLDSESLAVVNLIARTTESQGERLKEELMSGLREYLFTSSAAPMSEGKPPVSHVLTCDNCGQTIDAGSLKPTQIKGFYGCTCPDCGTPLSFGSFSEEGAGWARECGSKLDVMLGELERCSKNVDKILEEIGESNRRLAEQIESRRAKLFEVTHAADIDEAIVCDYAKRLLELVPDDRLANFYVFVSENNSLAVNGYLDGVDVVSCGAETVCAMLDYLVEPLEPRMETALISLVNTATDRGVFDRGQQTKYMTAIQQGKYFDPLAEYDLFIAYKSTDRAEVDALLRELEAQELRCFVAYRDLPHGKGSGGINYWTRLKLAMDNSRGIVFVSTPNSRSMQCDAIHREDESVDGGEGELYYFERRFPREEKVRIEYRPASDRESHTPRNRSVEQFLKRFFGDVQYCTTPEDVADTAHRSLHPMFSAPAGKIVPAEETAVSEEFAREDADALFDEGIAAEGEGRYEEAVSLFRRAVEHDHIRAKCFLGYCYEKGEGVDQNFAEAAKWYRRAAEQGDAFAQYNLALLYKNGRGVSINYAEALKWFQLAAEQSDKDAQTELGNCYFDGIGVKKDFREALKWYREAENEEGIQKAERALAEREGEREAAVSAQPSAAPDETDAEELYRMGCRAQDEKRYEEAVKYYRQAADLGHAAAMNNLAVCYFNGYGVKKSMAEHTRLLKSSAEKGYVPAQNNYGLALQNGRGVSPNYTEAAKWYRKAAEQGDAPAQVNLANCYFTGKGVKKDYGKALKWYREAGSEEGIQRAERALAEQQEAKPAPTPESYFSISGGVITYSHYDVPKDVVIPDSITAIADRAFANREELRSIMIPEGVRAIGRGAFSDCIGLTEIAIPASVTSIGEGVFGGCSELTTLSVSEDNPVYYDECNCIIDRERKILLVGCEEGELPDGVTAIGPRAFSRRSLLRTVTVPDGVTSIGESAFSGCSRLRTVTIADSVTAIGARAFSLCSDLWSVKLPGSLTSIGEEVFSSCREVTDIVIPDGVTSIGKCAFYGCSKLTNVTLPESLATIGAQAFKECGSLNIRFKGSRMQWKKIKLGLFNGALKKAHVTFEK